MKRFWGVCVRALHEDAPLRPLRRCCCSLMFDDVSFHDDDSDADGDDLALNDTLILVLVFGSVSQSVSQSVGRLLSVALSARRSVCRRSVWFKGHGDTTKRRPVESSNNDDQQNAPIHTRQQTLNNASLFHA